MRIRVRWAREATISWGGSELIFRNDWGAPLRMRLLASDTAITVRFFSIRLGRAVETATGAAYRLERPRTLFVRTRTLPPGVTRLVQRAGHAGFTIDYNRTVYRSSVVRRSERFRVRYQPEHAYVEVGAERTGGP